jgi:hypothetical protein
MVEVVLLGMTITGGLIDEGVTATADPLAIQLVPFHEKLLLHKHTSMPSPTPVELTISEQFLTHDPFSQ